MGQSTEEIEAKLAAFVDGELDAAGREEIEKHLQANPQHRKLLDDLMRGRDLLRDVPRENAPAEILDSIQSHLERRLLLDEQASTSSGRHAGGGMRRYMAIAAVLLLTGTLALVIYSVLPGSRHEGGLATVLERAEPAVEPASPEILDVRVARSAPSATDDALRDRAATAAVEAIRGVAGGALASAERRTEPEVARPVHSIDLSASAPAASDEPIAPVIVLAADDLATTERELSAVLLDNHVMYEQVTGRGTGRRIAEAAPVPPGGASAIADESVFVARKITRAQFQAIEQALQSPVWARKESVGEEAQQHYQTFRISELEGKLAEGDERRRAAKVKDESAEPSPVPAASLARQTGPDQNAGATPGTQTASRIAVGDKLAISLPLQTQSNIAGVQVVEVSPDGSVQVPPLESIPAVGLTTDELQTKLIDMVGAADVTVGQVAEPLTDMVIVVRPAALDESSRAQEEVPTTQPEGVDAPTTRPGQDFPSTAPATQQGG